MQHARQNTVLYQGQVLFCQDLFVDPSRYTDVYRMLSNLCASGAYEEEKEELLKQIGQPTVEVEGKKS